MADSTEQQPVAQPQMGINWNKILSHPLTWGIILGVAATLGYQSYRKNKRQLRSPSPRREINVTGGNDE